MRFILFVIVISACLPALGQNHCIPNRYSEVAVFDSSEIVIENNVIYGSAPQYFTGQSIELFMDVYYPDPLLDEVSLRPFILNIHGGGFIGGDKSELAYESIEFARRGFVVANINYRVGWNCDNVICFNCYQENLQKAIYCAVQDARAAMRFAKSQEAAWKIDPNNVFISGESAGSITALLSTFLDQNEANAIVPAGFMSEVGGLDESGNTLSETFVIKALVDQCGAVPNVSIMDNNPAIGIISFHDSQDCVVPYDNGALIACFCSGFLSYQGSHMIYLHQTANGKCAELHTAPQPFLPNHCTYPKLNLVKLASCFLKRTMCDFYMSFSDDDISAVPICSQLSHPSISGCTYPESPNYNPLATLDDGSCLLFETSCPGDFNNDGVVGVADLIFFIGLYQNVCPN
jgi:poly(3-hydroxybutyrate) depolymerase